MFNQRDAPLQMLDNPSLGDAVFAMGEGVREPTPEIGPSETDLRIEAMEGWIAVLEARIARLEAQTPLAYWRQFVAWIHRSWAALKDRF